MSPLVQAVDLLAKGIALISYILVLQACKLAGMRKAIAALTEQRSCKRRYIQTEETLIVGDVQDLIAKKDSSSNKAAKQPAKKVRKERHCGRCGKTGHNARTCAAEIVDLDKSENSE
jgi:NADH pyrophosphatase NudC (nudix superfamily)